MNTESADVTEEVSRPVMWFCSVNCLQKLKNPWPRSA